MKSKKGESLDIIYGRNPVIEALIEGRSFERIYVKENLTGEFEKTIRLKCKEQNIPLRKVPQIKLDKLSRNRNHQGVVGLGSLIKYQELSEVIPFLYERGESPLLMILDNIQDVRNIGAIARSAEVFGAQAIVLSGPNSGIINHDSIKASAGALTRLLVCREKNSLRAIEQLKIHGIYIIGSTLNSAESLPSLKMNPPVCIVLGSEKDGLHHTVEKACDQLVFIPQVGKTQSLNVSVAAGIILYELQRGAKHTIE